MRHGRLGLGQGRGAGLACQFGLAHRILGVGGRLGLPPWAGQWEGRVSGLGHGSGCRDTLAREASAGCQDTLVRGHNAGYRDSL